MQTHEYYQELCALMPIGQLTEEEYQELKMHLKECGSCRNVTEEFAAIVDEMPVEEWEVDDRDLTALQGASYRDRFIKRAVEEGVPFSTAVLTAPAKHPTWRRLRLKPLLVPVVALAAVVIMVVMSVQILRRWQEPIAPISSQEQPRTPHQQMQIKPNETAAKEQLARLDEQIVELEAQKAEHEKLITELRAQLSTSKSDRAAAKGQLSERQQRIAYLEKQTASAGNAMASLKAELQQVHADKDSIAANLVVQQYKVNDLVAVVNEKDSLFERERQLSTVAKDVREMMGARNLHILDVSDVDGSGRAKKSFGRVFLVEGKSLIFYAFDLGDRGNPAKVSFQAWGALEGRQGLAKNLGVFYVDDHAQKRWVLKVNDPEKLTAINSVFVTVEPLGGADRPGGKKLLYAFFGTQANHP